MTSNPGCSGPNWDIRDLANGQIVTCAQGALRFHWSLTMKEGLKSETFIERFCRRSAVPRDIAERQLLMRCVPMWKRPLWLLIEKRSPNAFSQDWIAIQEACRARSMKEILEVVEALHYRGKINPTFWRNQLNLRISGRRLQDIAKDYLESDA